MLRRDPWNDDKADLHSPNEAVLRCWTQDMAVQLWRNSHKLPLNQKHL